jgi:hypothetical protein
MPSVANDSRVPESGSVAGKKTLLKYSAAAVPTDEVVGLDRRSDRATDRDLLLLRRALDRVPVGDLLEVRVSQRWMPFGHGDLR